MNRKVIDKLRQAGNSVKTTFFRSKTDKIAQQNPKQEPSGDGKRGSFADIAKEKMKSFKSPQLDYMKQKLGSLKDSKPLQKLKGIDIKDSLKESTSKLKDTSQDMLNKLKEQTTNKLSDPKEKLQDIKQKLERTKEKIQQHIEGAKQKIESAAHKGGSRQEQLKEWVGQKVHNSQAHLHAIRELIQRQLREASKIKFSFLQDILQKMYWRFLLLLFLAVFAYGLGSSIPREIRKSLKKADTPTPIQQQQKAKS